MQKLTCYPITFIIQVTADKTADVKMEAIKMGVEAKEKGDTLPANPIVFGN